MMSPFWSKEASKVRAKDEAHFPTLLIDHLPHAMRPLNLCQELAVIPTMALWAGSGRAPVWLQWPGFKQGRVWPARLRWPSILHDHEKALLAYYSLVSNHRFQQWQAGRGDRN